MNDRVSRLLDDVSTIFGGMPGVFSTPQWGGRAYKLPGPGGDRGKPRLLAHVTIARDGNAINVDFKLPRERAVEEIDRLGWLAPHGFRTLAPSGWVTASLSDRRRVRALARLLIESRAMHGHDAPQRDRTPESSASVDRSARGDVADRIDRVMHEAIEGGWRPDTDGDFAL